MKKREIHYAWWVLIGCCAVMGGGLGVICNCLPIFYEPVSREMGFGMGQMAMTYTIRTLAGAFFMPFISKFYDKGHFRTIISVSAAAASGSLLAMSFFHSIWQWYLASAVMGALGCVIFTSTSFLVNNWFKEKTGFAMGLSAAFSGLSGAVFSPVGTWVIERYGWRAAYLFMGTLAMVMMLPFCMTVLHYSPAEIGMKPYGKSVAAAEQVYESRWFSAREEKLLYAASIYVAISIQSVSSLSQHLPKMAMLAGLSASLAALILSASMMGNLGGKLFLGGLYDRFGLKKITFLLQMLIGGSVLMFALEARYFSLDLVAGFFFGTHMALYTLTIPLIVRAVYGSGRFAERYPHIYAPASLVCAFVSTVVGYSYDLLGTYTPAFTVEACVVFAGGFCLLYLLKPRKALSAPVQQ